jgi:hypothetical protein
MKSMLDMYQSAYRALPAPLNPFDLMRTPWTPLAAGAESKDVIERVGDRPAPSAETGSETVPVHELQRRIEELEARLTKKSRSKKTAKPKSRRKS